MDARSTTVDAVRAFVWEQFPLARQKQASDHDSLIESGVVDSLGVLEIVTFLESTYGLVLTDADVVSENFISIAAIASFADSRRPPVFGTEHPREQPA
jgi:acyl carrier protein